jgi:hypothetical protein
MSITHELPPPGIAPPRPWPAPKFCAVCGRMDRRFTLVVYRGHTHCARHFAAALARDWRRFRRDTGLRPRERLPHDVHEEVIASVSA